MGAVFILVNEILALVNLNKFHVNPNIGNEDQQESFNYDKLALDKATATVLLVSAIVLLIFSTMLLYGCAKVSLIVYGIINFIIITYNYRERQIIFFPMCAWPL